MTNNNSRVAENNIKTTQLEKKNLKCILKVNVNLI